MLLAHNINAVFISVVLFRVGYEVGYKERRQAGWFKRWIAVCEGGAVGAAVGFAVGTAECEAEGPGFGSILVLGVGWPLKYCLGILLLRMKWIFFCIEERS